MTGLAYIGPAAVEFLDPQFTWSGAPTSMGMRDASFSGLVSWGVATQLQELVTNPDRSRTYGPRTGVLEYVWSDDRYLSGFNGFYVLESVSLAGDVGSSEDDLVPVTIGAAAVGERQVAIVRSGRARANAHGLAGRELLVAPFPVSTGNSGFAVAPGGTAVWREVDIVHGDGVFDFLAASRLLPAVIAAPGTLPSPVLPAIQEHQDPHPWLADRGTHWTAYRGGDCRAYDVSQGRAVYGPSHPLVEPSDLMLENGLARWWVGPRGLAPYLTAMMYADGAWRQVGHVALADFDDDVVLDGARLVKVTPDEVTAALALRGLGDVHVTLHRGERMLRVQHGTTRSPTLSTTRRVQWVGVPPLDGLIEPDSGAGDFDTAGIHHAEGEESVVFRCPPAVTQHAWSVGGTWLPRVSSAGHEPCGIFGLVDEAGTHVIVAWYDPADGALHVGNGVGMISTGPLTFDADEPVRFVAAFDTVDGLAVTCRSAAGTTTGADRTIRAAWSVTALEQLSFSIHTPWGALEWGDGSWGGELGASGGIDELTLFAGRVTNADAVAFVERTRQLEFTPTGARPVWYAAFDSLFPQGVAAATGRRVETDADDNGLKRMVASLVAVADAGALGIEATGAEVAFMAAIVDDETGNSAAELHDQFAAYSEQETRIR